MPGGDGEGETWNVEVRSIDVKAGGDWCVLLVLYFPVLWGEWGEQQDPQSWAPAARRKPTQPAPPSRRPASDSPSTLHPHPEALPPQTVFPSAEAVLTWCR